MFIWLIQLMCLIHIAYCAKCRMMGDGGGPYCASNNNGAYDTACDAVDPEVPCSTIGVGNTCT